MTRAKENTPKAVSIVEVGPRDGLQNEDSIVSTQVKVQFVRALAKAGLEHIEVSSFVRPDLVPQLADARELFDILADDETLDGVRLTALVPNERGLERALKAGVRSVAVMCAASETFSEKNVGCSARKAIERARAVAGLALSSGIAVRAYVSTAFHCPFEGNVDSRAAGSIVDTIRALGVREISLADTTGHATPDQVDELLTRVDSSGTLDDVALHLHDTHGRALRNARVGLDHGIREFDASAGGLGGCPFAPGASGNLATEVLVGFLENEGITTSVDLDGLSAARSIITEALGDSAE